MAMTIDYDHSRGRHTREGAFAALSAVFRTMPPASLLDVGCGTGTWLRAATELGVRFVVGVDGIAVPEDTLHLVEQHIKILDLSRPFDLGRQFEMALCLEVAEHLPEASAHGLISSITRHADVVLFSAACPGQPGQHHVNCRWPEYWQAHFNSLGYACHDTVRWKIWHDENIEPWYRQNMFLAEKSPSTAGQVPDKRCCPSGYGWLYIRRRLCPA